LSTQAINQVENEMKNRTSDFETRKERETNLENKRKLTDISQNVSQLINLT
jgi:hypothetical protein